jgi:outer membrane receptor for ferrienterochelin and colicins
LKVTFIFNMALAADPATEPVEEVFVTGTRTPRTLGESPVAVRVISRAEIEASGSQDVADLLEQVPGIDVQRTLLGASVRLRGLDPVHTLVLVDGQRVVGRKDGVLDLSRIPVDAIERIELVEGASSALYGSDALGGVLNIVTRRASGAPSATLSARGASPVGGDASAGVALGGDLGGLRLDLGWHGASPTDAVPGDPATTTNGVQQVDGALAADWRPSADLTLSARGSWAGTDARGVDLGTGGAVLDRRNLTEDGLVRVGLDWFPDDRSRVTGALGGSLFRDQFANDQRRAAGLDVYQESREALLQLDGQVDRSIGRHFASLGLEGDHGRLTSERLDGGTGERWTGAVYLQDELRVLDAPRLVAVAGIRGDLDSWFGGAVAPSLGARFDPVRAVILRASAGTGWRAPNFRELLLAFDNASVGYRVEGNPDLEPERSLSLSAGAEWNPSTAASLTLQVHRDRLRDLIQIGTLSDAPGLVRYGYLNVADAVTRGVDLGLSLDPVPAVGVDLSATWLDARDLTARRPLEGRAPLRGTIALRLAGGRDGPRLVTRTMLVGPRPFYFEDARTDAPPHALMDLRLEQRLTDALGLSAGVDNLLGAGDPQFLPVPPRLLYAGIDARVGGAP